MQPTKQHVFFPRRPSWASCTQPNAPQAYAHSTFAIGQAEGTSQRNGAARVDVDAVWCVPNKEGRGLLMSAKLIGGVEVDEKRVFPRFLLQSNQPIHPACSGHTTRKPKQKIKERKRETNADTDRLTRRRRPATAAPAGEVPSRPSSPKRRAPNNISKKECDDVAAVARTSPRISPGTRRVVEEGVSPTPFRKAGGTSKRHRAGAGQADRDFSRSTTTTTIPHTSLCTIHSTAHQSVHHDYRAALAVSLELPTRGMEERRKQRPRKWPSLDRREGQPPPPTRSRPDAMMRTCQALRPS